MNLKMKILFSFVICFAVRSCAALGVDEQSKEFWNENAKTLLEERSKITLPKAVKFYVVFLFLRAFMIYAISWVSSRYGKSANYEKYEKINS